MRKFNTGIAIACALSSAAVFSGCGQQAYVATATVDAQNAPGTYAVPAKVDILLVEDDTGGMFEVYPQISSAMPNILTTLQSYGWDYHFATIPATNFRTVNQVTASTYDSNWGSSWTAPYPGAPMFLPGTLEASVFRTTSEYNAFLQYGDIQTTDGLEPAFSNITNELYNLLNQTPNTNFIRSDAMLVVLMVGNGNDTSLVNFCKRSDGVTVPCEELGQPECSTSDMSTWGTSNCSSSALSFNYFQNLLANVKTSSSGAVETGMLRFYSIVSEENVSGLTCQGGNAFLGSRYIQMSQALNGAYFDLCSGGSSAVSNALTQLSTDLQNTRASMYTKYLQISQQPDVSTIVVTRNDGTVIPQSSTNGWTYAGDLTNTSCTKATDEPTGGTSGTICYQLYTAAVPPVYTNAFTGYAIELHGSYVLSGSQSASVTYTQAGLQSTQ